MNPGTKSRPIDRFEAKIRKTESCWIWVGAVNQGGYGRFWPGGERDAPTVQAHRWSYEHFVGPIPDGLQLDHLCRIRHCVNPDHLEPVTQRVNLLRGEGVSATRARQTACKRGHPFDDNNTYFEPNKPGRRCRQCTRDYQRQRRQEGRQAA